ncbi:MAG: pseudouridine synthase [Bacteroidota bacterium]|nr:pseudouridine synthase [Bacteroidota bacterium]
MNYRNRLQYYLVKQTSISNKQAKEFIGSGNVTVNDILATENVFINPYSKVVLNQKIISKTHELIYVAYHKPAGIECTLNEKVNCNLKSYLPEALKNLIYAGRLDKASEGLLLLTNDGHLINKIIAPEAHLPKKYFVGLEKPYNHEFVRLMENGIQVSGKITFPCKVEPIDEQTFNIILTQGMNRQIRRMCFTLGNYVIQLRRTSIGAIDLGELGKSEFRFLSQYEVNYLQNL